MLDAMLAHRPAGREPAGEPSDGFIGSSAAMRIVQKTIGLVADRGRHRAGDGRGPAPERRSWRAPSTATDSARGAPSWRSTAPRSRATCWKASCSATCGAPSRVRPPTARGPSGTHTAARCSWTRSATWSRPCRPRSCASCRSASSPPWAGGPWRSTCASSRRPHRALEDGVRSGGFREDLYYRLAVVPVHLPPLRERVADILPLRRAFPPAGRRPAPGPGGGGAARRPSLAGQRARVAQRRPAPVRAGQGAARHRRRPPLSGPDAADRLHGRMARRGPPPPRSRGSRSSLIRRALDRSTGNRAEAARMLNIRRQHLYTKLDRYGLGLSGDRTEPVGEDDS